MRWSSVRCSGADIAEQVGVKAMPLDTPAGVLALWLRRPLRRWKSGLQRQAECRVRQAAGPQAGQGGPRGGPGGDRRDDHHPGSQHPWKSSWALLLVDTPQLTVTISDQVR